MECDTPTTIAIQGDWGTGKTSMMNMIRETYSIKDLEKERVIFLNKMVISFTKTVKFSENALGE